jgi:MATE family multidrug resistance protein
MSLNILKYASVLFTFYATIAILDCLRLVLCGCLRGLHNTIIPMKISFISYVIIIIPFAYLSGVVLNFGIKGIMSSFLLGLIISVIALSYYLKFLFNQKINNFTNLA